jgi:hypothetical protein
MLEARMRGLLAAAAAAVGRPALELGEATQVVRYREGQFYALHCESSRALGRPVEAEIALETDQPTDRPTNQPPLTNYRPLPKIKFQTITTRPRGAAASRSAARRRCA